MFAHGITHKKFLWNLVSLLLLVTSLRIFTAQNTVSNITIWDTSSPLPNAPTLLKVQDKTKWKVVPTATAKTYSCKGDLVLENEYLTFMACSKIGKVAIYSKSGKKRAEIMPLPLKGKEIKITSSKISSKTENETTAEVYFSPKKPEKRLPVSFSLRSNGIVAVNPDKNINGVSILGPIEYAVLPTFIGDDLIYNPKNFASLKTLHLPSENFLVGLLKGEDSMLVVTYPKGKQEIRLILDNKEFKSIEFENDGKPIYLAILDAEGIWHKEELTASYLEQDVAINWKRPFPAKWITQLYEDEVKTTYYFREQKGEIWRGGIGYYTWPIWFEGEKGMVHLGKKIPPREEAIIYFLERKETTPPSIVAPVDIIQGTLDKQTCDAILDFEGRKIRSLRRENAVIGAATCEVTDGMEPIFKAGQEVEKREYIEGGVEDMVYFITRQRERINEYLDFANKMLKFLNQIKESKPHLRAFLDQMEKITREMPQEYSRAQEAIKTLEYAQELAAKTKALTQKKDPGNLPAFLDLKVKWRGMGGAQDDLVRKFHTITRKLFQEAGYSCVNQPEAAKIAEEIRERTKKCLRNPNWYEMWSN